MQRLAQQEVAAAVELLGDRDSTAEAMRHVMAISREIGMQIMDIRSRLVKDVCSHLVRIVKVVGRDFEELANALLPQVAHTAKSASAAIRQPGANLLGKISELARYDVGLMRKIFLESPQEKVRVLLLEQLRIIFIYWPGDEVGRYDSAVLGMMTAGMKDHSPNVRKTARDVLARFSSLWSHRIDELVAIPSSQSRALFVKEHRDCALSMALLEKYPELANKSDVYSRSKVELAKKRSTFQKSPQHKKEQAIEIHVPTPPSSKRRQNTMKSMNAREIARTTPTTQEEPGLSRQLFQDGDFTDGDYLEDDIPPAFDGSQMHRYDPRASQSKRESATGDNLGVTERKTAIPSGIRSPRSKTDLRRDSGAKRVQDSRIPGASTLSPPLRSRDPPVMKATANATVCSDRFGIESTGIPRPRTYSDQAQVGGSAVSGSVDAIGEESGGGNLGIRDDYFNHPIPSSASATAPTPPSADNVTIRRRQRHVSHQEVQDSQAQGGSFLPPPAATDDCASQDFHDEPPTQSLQFAQPKDGSGLEKAPAVEDDYISYEARSGAGDVRRDDVQPSYDRDWGLRGDGKEQRWYETESMFECSGDRGQKFDSGEIQGCDTGFQVEFNDGFDHQGETNSAPPDGIPCGSEFASRAEGPSEEVIEAGYAPHGRWDERAALDEHPETNSLLSQHDEGDLEEEFAEAPAPHHLPKDLPKDALNSLQEVRERVARLRAQTMPTKTSHGIPLQTRFASGLPNKTHTLAVPPITQEPQQESPETHRKGLQSEPRVTQPSYLERLRDADMCRFQPQECDATPREDSMQDVFGSSELAGREPQLSGPSGASDYAGVNGDNVQQHDTADFTRDYQLETIPDIPEEADPTYPPEPVQQNLLHAQRPPPIEAAVAHFDDTGGYAIPKHYADQDDRSRHPRERSRSPDHHTQKDTHGHRIPPTTMGQKLNAVFANARDDIVVDTRAESSSLKDTTVAPPISSPTSSLEEPALPSDDSPRQGREEKPTGPRGSDDLQSTEEPGHGPESLSKPSVSTSNSSPALTTSGWSSPIGVYIVVGLAVLFGVTGVLQAAAKMRNSHEYHLAMKLRIDKFEASIAESHKKMHKLEENYAVWSEYVRALAEEDEANALAHLESIHREVERWQEDMKTDLVEFRQSLLSDSLDAVLAPLREENGSLDADK